MGSNSQNKDSQKSDGSLGLIKAYLLIVLGIGLSIWAVLGIVEKGFSLAERGNPEQLEGGLYPLLLVIGVGVAAYGGIERWLNR